ncbi:MAG TPA: DotA/TraY family protein [Gammaproteobacteria bacterium]|nr:DotA/TraY family protein [Gammaproteobacteria bacterium]
MALPTLFTPASGDASITYLYGIFGTVNGVIAPNGVTVSDQVTLLGALFQQFNTIVLAVAVLIVVYITVVGIMNTAHEGQFMGKNWNNLWIPIRVVLGIGVLVPTGTGYCGLQIIMMWVIVQGIGAADTLWATSINYYNQMGSIYAKIGVPTVEVKSSLKGLFQGMVCAKSAAATFANPIAGNDDIRYFCTQNPGDNYCKNAANPDFFSPSFSEPTKTSYSFGPNSACGTLNYCNLAWSCSGGPDSLACKTCTIQQKILKDSIPLLAQVADKYVVVDNQYMNYWSQAKEALALPVDKRPKLNPPKFVQDYCTAENNTACMDLPSPTGDGMSAPSPVISNILWEYGLKPDVGKVDNKDDFFTVMVNAYSNEMGVAIDDYLSTLRKQQGSGLPPMLQTLLNGGWIVAGSSYFVISRGTASNVQAMMPNVSYKVNMDVMPLAKPPLVGYRNNYRAGPTLTCLAQGGEDCGSPSSGVMDGPVDGTMDALNAYQQGLSYTETDPLAQLMSLGNMYLSIIEIIFWIFFGVMMVVAILAMVTSMQIFGSGMAQGIASIFMDLFLMFGPLVMIILTMFLTIGALYAVYVPMIPFTIFTLGAIGWMISTVEAMVAAPLVALGIISPSGHHELLGKAEPALGLLFNIFMRPSLMIFGLFAAMLLSMQVLKMTNMGFAFFSYTSGLSGGGVFKLIIVMLTNVAFNIAILNKTFTVIYIIPERVLSWIGIQVPHEGAAELQEVKGGVEKGAQTAGELGKGMEGMSQGARRAGSKDAFGGGGGGGAQISPPPPPPPPGGGGGGGGSPPPPPPPPGGGGSPPPPPPPPGGGGSPPPPPPPPGGGGSPPPPPPPPGGGGSPPPPPGG